MVKSKSDRKFGKQYRNIRERLSNRISRVAGIIKVRKSFSTLVLLFALSFILSLIVTIAFPKEFIPTKDVEIYLYEHEDNDIEGRLSILLNVNQPFCKIMAVDRKLKTGFVTQGNEIKITCNSGKSRTKAVDLLNGNMILKKSSDTYCIKCCYKPGIIAQGNALEWDSRCYYFNVIKVFPNTTDVAMVQTNCFDMCGEQTLGKNMTTTLHSMLSLGEKVKRKMKYWESWKKKVEEIKRRRKMKTETKVMRIILVNVESLSRQESRQNLPRTLKRLRDSGFVEMRGFSHISAEPVINLLASLSGLNAENWDQECSFSETGYLDDCPFIWKRLSSLKYITAYAQDTSIFNSSKIRNYKYQGDFLRHKQIDYILDQPSFPTLVNDSCRESHSINTLIEFSTRVNSRFADYPLFSMTRFANENHVEIGLDDKLWEFFGDLESSFENSFVALYSTNGMGKNFEKARGRPWEINNFEPVLFLRIPKIPKEMYRDFRANLELNSGRLTTMHNLYETVVHVARMTCIMVKPTANESECFQKDISKKQNTDSSLLFPISQYRNCSDARIPEEVCPCDLDPKLVTKILPFPFPKQQEMGDSILHNLNNLVPNIKLCSEFRLVDIQFKILIRHSSDWRTLDYLVRIRVEANDNPDERRMGLEQRIRFDSLQGTLMTLGLPVWTSNRTTANSYSCLQFAFHRKTFFLRKLYCICKLKYLAQI